MTSRHPKTFQRRQFLQATGGLIAGATMGGALVRGDDLPKYTDFRAISGDPAEPDWDERLTITVGPKNADLVGTTERVIQAGVDYIASQGGGTVRILPGTYRLRNSIFLRSNIRLVGSGDDSVLIKEPSATTKITLDGDHWDQEVTVADPKGFRVGDGVRLVSKDMFTKAPNMCQRTLIATKGNRFKLDSRLHERFHLGGDPQIATNFALLQCTEVAGVTIENLTLDGNKAKNEMVDKGMFDDGCIRMDSANRITIRGVTLHDFYCDGIVWGISHDVVVEKCHLYDGARLAIHPGSGSQRPIVRGNHVERTPVGIYFCWGTQHGLYEKNVIEDCSTYGIQICYRDTDNLICDNDIRRSGKVGITCGSARNRIEGNRIVDIGDEQGVGIDIGAESTTVTQNELRQTGKPASRIGIRIPEGIRNVHCAENQIQGFATAILDSRKSKAGGPNNKKRA